MATTHDNAIVIAELTRMILRQSRILYVTENPPVRNTEVTISKYFKTVHNEEEELQEPWYKAQLFKYGGSRGPSEVKLGAEGQEGLTVKEALEHLLGRLQLDMTRFVDDLELITVVDRLHAATGGRVGGEMSEEAM